ncbi:MULTISPECIES: hypothetical protein [Acidovorax]|jgi:hypothetical protein|uniref:Uncharacterized protein n=1 Tax=Acidovorax soli TaxID=592050 RepID=A0A1H4F2V6_9BURK|nr:MULTISPECIES: hypothetical protein [Acidovorax]SEA91666.1 hypothetical protein SAMN05421875_1474 [Acidovorax soli]
MWKIVVGFVLFAALSLFVIMKAGDKVDMSGEKHGADSLSAPETPASAPVPAAPAPAASVK